MKFTQADLENISKNFKYIRLACGYKTQEEFAWALDPKEGKYPGFSLDMIKKYEGGGYNISEQTVRTFSRLVGFPFEEIVFGDLSILGQGSLALGQFSINDLISALSPDVEAIKAYVLKRVFEVPFPLFSTKKCLDDRIFSKAFDLSNKIFDSEEVKDEEVKQAIENAIDEFEKTDFPESSLNIMSLLGRYYRWRTYCVIGEGIIEKITSNTYENYIDFRKDFYSRSIGCNNRAMLNDLKRSFLDRYNYKLAVCMKKVAAIGKYKDYVHYYLAVRYYYGFMDNDITKINDEEMNSFGISLLDSLEKIGNKYAKAFNKYTKLL